jgi:hypothetical protein
MSQCAPHSRSRRPKPAEDRSCRGPYLDRDRIVVASDDVVFDVLALEPGQLSLLDLVEAQLVQTWTGGVG